MEERGSWREEEGLGRRRREHGGRLISYAILHTRHLCAPGRGGEACLLNSSDGLRWHGYSVNMIHVVNANVGRESRD